MKPKTKGIQIAIVVLGCDFTFYVRRVMIYLSFSISVSLIKLD
jgi:hypothetical protein